MSACFSVKRFRDVKLEHPPQELMQMKPVRIVFAVMVAGRAVRQVKRLIKAINHPDHYVFIHVDKVGANISLFFVIWMFTSCFVYNRNDAKQCINTRLWTHNIFLNIVWL